MKKEIKIEKLLKKSLFVATPMYGGMCNGTFTRATNDLAMLCQRHGLEITFFYLFNESLITRARNYCCDAFLRSKCTHMIFIDSDIGFDPSDVISMMVIIDEEDETCPYDILCAPYPKKSISWEKISMAVNQGFADKDPEKLSNFVGDYVFNPVPGQTEFSLTEPVEVLEGGTGFMMFTKNILKKYAEEYPQMSYLPDHARTKDFDGSREIVAFFDALIDNKHSHLYRELDAYLEANPDSSKDDLVAFLKDPETRAIKDALPYSNRYLSEDYMFCQWARNIGLKVWLCPWMKLTHSGNSVYGGSLMDLAQIGASPTHGEVKKTT